MKRSALLSLCFLLSALSIFAQTDAKAKAILDKASLMFKQKAVKFDFMLTLEDTKTDKKKVVKGDAVVKGNKFKLTVPAVHTYFDGKSEYVYVLKNKEVSISVPTKAELQDINPALILTSYSQKGSVQFSLDSKQELPYYVIDVFPDFKLKKNYYKSIIRIDKKTLQVISIKVLCQNGVHSLFQLSNYDTKQDYKDNFFVFDLKANPKVNVNDLR